MIPQPARAWTGFAGEQAAVAASPQLVSTRNDPLNRMALYFGLASVFTQFSVLPQVLGSTLHTNIYLLYIVIPPAILAMIFSGGLRSCFRGRLAFYWVGFGCWLWLAVPFSTWPGASFPVVFNYWRSNLIMLFIIGSMLYEWSDVRKVMNAIAASAVVIVLCSSFLRVETGDRMGVAMGSIGNPNDYAGHLVLVLPFLLWVALQGKVVLRIPALAFIAYGLYLILATSSRGAFLALAAGVLYWVLAGTGRQKIAVVLIVPVAAVVLAAAMPEASSRRLMAIWNDRATSAESSEALDSSRAREYTFRTSIRYTFERPLFGVGPGQFPLYEGMHERVTGTHGYWHETHCTYTQASAEAGIPAFLLFMGGVVSTLLLFRKTLREARKRQDCKDIALAVLCIMLGMVGFLTVITFLNFAYFFYLPSMGGLAIGVRSAAQREFELRAARLAASPA